MGRWVPILLLVTAMTGPIAAGAQTREEANAELEAVRKQIDKLRDEVESEGRRRSRAEKALAKVEKEEQQTRRELAKVRTDLDKTRTRQRELEQKADRQRAEIEEQRRVLARQIRIAYINGDEEWLKVALNQQDTTQLGRRMTYYSYLSRQRSEAIELLQQTLRELEQTVEEIAAEAVELARLEKRVAAKPRRYCRDSFGAGSIAEQNQRQH